MKRDALELRCTHAANETEPLQTRQRPVVGAHHLVIPPHAIIEQLFDIDVKVIPCVSAIPHGLNNDRVRRCRGFGYGIGARRGRLPSRWRIGAEAEPPDAHIYIEQKFEQ
ncbi:hypothetical protein GCM10009632_30630 [Mycolicibacterium alvei]|uniref:Uncharacterized protein n=1 Tax=Mycolicibacterium alvei TaxID=67081 RepID=A0A6N4ULM2_9MYCO|nr:hypothetical protein MALV_11510 [Mycolicibacterium alvei]